MDLRLSQWCGVGLLRVRLSNVLPYFCILGEKSHWSAELFSSGSNLGPDVNQSNQPKDGLGTLTMGLPLRPSPPQGWSLRRPLLLTATSCRPKTAGIPPLASSGNKRTDLSFAEPGIPHSPLVSPAHGSLQPEISKRGIPAAFEGLSSRVMGTGDR